MVTYLLHFKHKTLYNDYVKVHFLAA